MTSVLKIIYNAIIVCFGGSVEINPDIITKMVGNNLIQNIVSRITVMLALTLIWLLMFKLPMLMLSKLGKTPSVTLLTCVDRIGKVLMLFSIVFLISPIININMGVNVNG